MDIFWTKYEACFLYSRCFADLGPNFPRIFMPISTNEGDHHLLMCSECNEHNLNWIPSKLRSISGHLRRHGDSASVSIVSVWHAF